MKKAIMLGILLLMIPMAAFAQLPETGYIGLFADAARDTFCAWGAPVFFFDMYVYCLPGDHGLKCAEFAILYPESGIFAGVATPNPALSVAQGNLADGMSCCFLECQWDWQWTHSQTIIVQDATPKIFEIIPSPVPIPPVYQFANCDTIPIKYPKEPCTKFTNLYVNTCGPTAVEETSWGAIKSLYRD